LRRHIQCAAAGVFLSPPDLQEAIPCFYQRGTCRETSRSTQEWDAFEIHSFALQTSGAQSHSRPWPTRRAALHRQRDLHAEARIRLSLDHLGAERAGAAEAFEVVLAEARRPVVLVLLEERRQSPCDAKNIQSVYLA